MAGQAVITIRDRQWQVSLATSYLELTQGLSDIPQIPSGTGMLFDLGYDTTFTVTTKEMLFPIDIIRISSSMTITDVAHNVLPGQLINSTSPARYFLEVNAGEAEDIGPADQVAIQLMTSATPLQIDMSGLVVTLLAIVLMAAMVRVPS
jgi:uncharacterized membrane protein (UPF0127 family)